MLIIGIDPGVSGGVGFVMPGETTIRYVHKMPDTDADFAALLTSECVGESHVKAYLEKVGGFIAGKPRTGSSMFKFGQSYGFIRGVLAGLKIPYEEVAPNTWMKAMQCQTGGDKKISKAKAQQLFPSLAITNQTADAILIAEYGFRFGHNN